MGRQPTTIRNANSTNGNAGVPARRNWAHLAVSRTALCGAIVLAGLAVAADWLRPVQPSVVPSNFGGGLHMSCFKSGAENRTIAAAC